jgi:serine/threonine protein phosphatase PrpC
VVSKKACDLISQGIKTGFLKLDEHLSNEKGADGEEREKSGTTAVCAILSPEYIFFGNLGKLNLINKLL